MCRRAAAADVGDCQRHDAGRVLSTAQEAQAVHALPDDDPRAGVRRQLVHHAPEALGDRLPAAPKRATGQGLVPEPANEAEEAQRARQANDIPRRRRLRLPAVRLVAAVDVTAFCAAPPHVAMTSESLSRRPVSAARASPSS